MTRANKKRIAILVMYIARIVGQSLRDAPLALLIAGFLFSAVCTALGVDGHQSNLVSPAPFN